MYPAQKRLGCAERLVDDIFQRGPDVYATVDTRCFHTELRLVCHSLDAKTDIMNILGVHFFSEMDRV